MTVGGELVFVGGEFVAVSAGGGLFALTSIETPRVDPNGVPELSANRQ